MTSDSDDGIEVRMRRDLSQAMKARDRVAIAALRSALGEIANAGAVTTEHASTAQGGDIAGAVPFGSAELAPRSMTDADSVAVVRREVSERDAAAEEFDKRGRHDRGSQLRAEADVLRRYLD